jgi:methylated-DNA-[protein]-cysteine S-methyltransferase
MSATWALPIKQNNPIGINFNLIVMSEFQARVLELVSRIPKGKVTTYKELARALGCPKACRAVGNALARNPRPLEIPCHRVVRSDGRLGGYRSGRRRKMRLLAEEGVKIEGGKVNLKKYIFKFD